MHTHAAFFHLTWQWTLLMAVLLAGACAMAADAPAAQQRVQLPPLRVAPDIDGVIHPAEWAGAVKFSAFFGTFSSIIEPRQGYCCLGYDANNIYLAMSTETPSNNQLITEVTQHDENTCMDDSVEFWLDPHRANHLSGKDDQRIYQMIFNSHGVFLDASWLTGQANDRWDVKNVLFKGRIVPETHRWEFEMAIPWQNFGYATMPADGREIGLLIARNWKNPWVQAPMYPAGGFSDWRSYLVIGLDANAPVVQEQSLGPIYAPRVDYQATILNPGAETKQYQVSTVVTSTDMPAKSNREVITVGADQQAPYRFDTGENYLHKGAQHTIDFTVSSLDGKTVLFHRTLVAQDPREKIWDVSGDTAQATHLFIAYYPTSNELLAKLDTTSLSEAAKYTTAKVELLDAAGKVLATQAMPLEKQVGQQRMSIPNLPNGTYTVRATLDGAADMKPFEQSFVRQHFPWEKSVLGISEQVFPPYTPITTAKNTLNVVQRRYTMNGFGLWNSIQAKGKEVLAAPITLDFTTKEGAGRWQHSAGAFTESKPALATYTAQADAGPLHVTTTSATEYDGCMKVTMTLAPGATPQEVQALWLNIPIKDELAPFWHIAVSGSIRANPTGAAPAGHGLVWDSLKTGNGAMLGNMLPYIWLGGAERGLCWFADNDKGWVTDDEKPAMTLTRDNGVLTLRIYLINKPVTLTQPRTIVFGLQASPTKPMPADWRAKTNIPMHGGSNGYWGMYSTFADKYPAQQDYRFTDEQLSARISGMADGEFLARWIKEKLTSVSTNAEWVKDRTGHFGSGMNWAATAKDAPLCPYFEEHFQNQTAPEFITFQDEWGTQAFTKRLWETTPDKSWGAQINFSRSYQDFALWHALQWYTRGFGLYCDNTFPHNCYNPNWSEAYVREDGKVQPSSLMWALRDYHKRLWVLEQQCRPLTPFPLLISLHMTNGNILPVITWGDTSLDNEWNWENGTAPFPPAVLLTEMSGLQAGSYPHALYPLLGDAKNYPQFTKEQFARSEWGMRMVHEILRGDRAEEQLVRTFGYGTPGVAVLHYWDTDERPAGQPGIAVDNAGVKWIGLWKPATNELLVVLVNWEKGDQPAALTINPPKGVSFTACLNAETNQPMPAGAVQLPGYGVALVKYRVK